MHEAVWQVAGLTLFHLQPRGCLVMAPAQPAHVAETFWQSPHTLVTPVLAVQLPGHGE